MLNLRCHPRPWLPVASKRRGATRRRRRERPLKTIGGFRQVDDYQLWFLFCKAQSFFPMVAGKIKLCDFGATLMPDTTMDLAWPMVGMLYRPRPEVLGELDVYWPWLGIRGWRRQARALLGQLVRHRQQHPWASAPQRPWRCTR